ncbi:hypothetical protein D3C81_1972860 [compost metagenome]
MIARGFKLGENVLVAYRDTLRINVGITALDVEPGDHFFNVLGHEKRVGFTRRLVGKGTFFRHPVMLQIVPAALEHDCMHAAAMAVTRQHAGLPHPQKVDVVATAGIE